MEWLEKLGRDLALEHGAVAVLLYGGRRDSGPSRGRRRCRAGGGRGGLRKATPRGGTTPERRRSAVLLPHHRVPDLLGQMALRFDEGLGVKIDGHLDDFAGK